jgi:ribA/ribD-fused uncharacterized protein
VEHRYQALKSADPAWIARNAAAPTPADARHLGRYLPLRPDWDRVKVAVMTRFLRQKFAQPALRAMLLATGGARLIEGNRWGDRFWGVDLTTRKGQNMLGCLLMRIREEIGRAG